MMNRVSVLLSFVLESIASFQLLICRAQEPDWQCSIDGADVRRFNDPVGKRAIVVEPVNADAPGRVRFQGTTWPARSLEDSFQRGEPVLITELESITMVVNRLTGSPSEGNLAEQSKVAAELDI